MKKMLVPIIILVIIAIGIAMYFMNRPSNTTPPSTAAPTAPTNSTQPSTTATGTTIDIRDFSFTPQNLTVKKGAIVTWTNHDSATHTIVESDGKTGPKSGDIANGHSYSFTYDTVGTFTYKCSIHPSMTGAVTVTD